MNRMLAKLICQLGRLSKLKLCKLPSAVGEREEPFVLFTLLSRGTCWQFTITQENVCFFLNAYGFTQVYFEGLKAEEVISLWVLQCETLFFSTFCSQREDKLCGCRPCCWASYFSLLPLLCLTTFCISKLPWNSQQRNRRVYSQNAAENIDLSSESIWQRVHSGELRWPWMSELKIYTPIQPTPNTRTHTVL